MNTLRGLAWEWYKSLTIERKQELFREYLTSDEDLNRIVELSTPFEAEVEFIYQQQRSEADKLWDQGEINPDL